MANSILSRAFAGPTLQEGAALLAALQEALREESRGLLVPAWQRLRPYTVRFVPPAAAGPLWETCARLAMAGAAPLDARQALTRALHAYQQEHDVPGMARVHDGLGGLLVGAGELREASREYGYAYQLSGRAGSAAQRIGSLCRQAEAALLMRDADASMAAQIDQALALCRALPDSHFLEAQARLLAAQAAFVAGYQQEGARQLLWAERLVQQAPHGAPSQMGVSAGAVAASEPAQAMAMLRTEALYRMGFVRRGLGCLRTGGAFVADTGPSDGGALPLEGHAHQLRLSGACLLLDQPAAAYAALGKAEQSFARLRQLYFRTFCQVALVRAAHRLGRSDEVRARVDALAAARLLRWPWLQSHFDEARTEADAPVVRVRGAVTAPWMQEVRHVSRNEPASSPPPKAADGVAAAGIIDRLQAAWGRLRGDAVPRASA